MSIRLQRVSDDSGLTQLGGDWNRLLAESRTNSFFLRWEWLRIWWENYRDGDTELCIVLVFRDDALIGIAPFYIRSLTWKNVLKYRRLMFLGTTDECLLSQHMDLIYRAGDEKTVVGEVLAYIRNEDLCDEISLQKVDTSSSTIGVLEEVSRDTNLLYRVENTAESPYITLPPDYETYLKERTSSTRHQVKSNLRKLSRHRGVEFRKTGSPDELKNDFTELVRLHQYRWVPRMLPGSFSDERFFAFQKAVMEEILLNNHLELRFLAAAGRNIAVLYNIAYNGKVYFYQSGLDISFDRSLSPGLLLHNHSIRDAIERGLGEYDFLLMGNMDSYKKRWSREFRNQCDIYMARPGIRMLLMSARNAVKDYYNSAQRAR